MDSLPGNRDMADAPDDKTRIAIGQDYMSAVARMHSLPVEPFVAVGMHRPETAEDLALVGLHAYLPNYKRTKRKLAPLLEFVIGWLRRNVPTHRTTDRYIQIVTG